MRYIREGVQVTTVGPASPSLFDREFFGDYEEIQQVTGLKLGTVRSRINRARTRFRALIKPMLKNESLLAELEEIEARAAEAKDDDPADE